jgi:hypothetical protein
MFSILTPVQGGNSLETKMNIDGSDCRNQIYVDGIAASFFVIYAGEWAGAQWTAPAGEVVTGVKISGYCGHNGSNMGYGVLGGKNSPTQTVYYSHHEAGFYNYANVSVAIPETEQVGMLQFRPYWNLEAAITGAGTDYPSYSGTMTSIMISTTELPTVQYSDEVTVDGDLGTDWADAEWKPFDKVYNSTPGDIEEGAWAVKWGKGGTRVYMAVKVRDTAHFFTNDYTDWASRDAVELYLHTTGTDSGPYGDNNYSGYQEQAQEWAVGIRDDDRSLVWVTNGYPPSYGVYVPTVGQFTARGHEDGDWLIYEAEMTPFEYFGGRRGNPDIVSPLQVGDIVGADVTVVGNNNLADPSSYGIFGYTGMKSSGHNEGGWSGDYTLIAQHRLVRKGVQGTIALPDLAASRLGRSATVQVLDGGNTVLETHPVVLDAAGTYSFVTALRGTYTIEASSTGFAPQTQWVTITGGDDLVNFTLSGLAGDANHDGKVDVSDLGILAANYGTTAGAIWEKGDFNRDGTVDVSDLGILAANYGAGTGASLDFNADAKTLGLAAEVKEDAPVTSTFGCGSVGLPLIAGFLLMGVFLVKLDE